MRGRFLEISLASTDIIASLAFYQALGFRELFTIDARRHAYAVTSDGRACIGLHDREQDAPALAFVVPGLADTLVRGIPAGLQPGYTRLGDEDFHEAVFSDADGHTLAFMEARTFSPPAFGNAGNSLLGYFEGVSLPVRDLQSATARWENLGFVALSNATDSADTALLTSDALNIYLSARPQKREPELLFSGANLAARIAALKQRAINFEQEVASADGAQLRTPEGLAIRLLEER